MSNDLRFDDQIAVITGAGGGLGKQYALLLASRGARVVVNDIGGSVTGSGSNTSTRFATRLVTPCPEGPLKRWPRCSRRSWADQAG